MFFRLVLHQCSLFGFFFGSSNVCWNRIFFLCIFCQCSLICFSTHALLSAVFIYGFSYLLFGRWYCGTGLDLSNILEICNIWHSWIRDYKHGILKTTVLTYVYIVYRHPQCSISDFNKRNVMKLIFKRRCTHPNDIFRNCYLIVLKQDYYRQDWSNEDRAQDVFT